MSLSILLLDVLFPVVSELSWATAPDANDDAAEPSGTDEVEQTGPDASGDETKV